MASAAIASWYHCSVKPVSRSAGRSVVAAAAYRLGECLQDERYAVTHDYTRRRGVEATFTVAPIDAPQWAHEPESLWNAAERAETRKNSTLAREVELALPACLSPEDRQLIVERFAGELVERYRVAVSVAIHSPGRGDERNYHAHILFTTREMTPSGLGAKTRILDARATGPQEVMKLRELAANIINEALEDANADIRVDHRSFSERGIEQEPTTHLGPSAAGMEQRGEPSDRGDLNRQTEKINALIEERNALEGSIAKREAPPRDRDDVLERMRDDGAGLAEIILTAGSKRDVENDGLAWWQRVAVRIQERARSVAAFFTQTLGQYWQPRPQDRAQDPDKGIDR